MRLCLVLSIFLSCISSNLFCLATVASSYTEIEEVPTTFESKFPSKDQLQEIAESITVRVYSNQRKGSGTLIGKHGSTYRILTNAHVLLPGKPFRVQLVDGEIYEASQVQSINWKGRDLALLKFQSYKDYQLACLNHSLKVSIGKSVFASGFPYDSQELAFTEGRISLFPPKKLDGGYQIGYTNLIQQGMSGGPILNGQGELIGINGMIAYPILNTSYIFEDGSSPNDSQISLMRRVSWGIPISTFLEAFNMN